MLCLVRQIPADFGNWKHNLLERPVVPYDLDLPSVCCIVFESRVRLKLTVTVHLCWTQLLRQFLAVACQLKKTGARFVFTIINQLIDQSTRVAPPTGTDGDIFNV